MNAPVKHRNSISSLLAGACVWCIEQPSFAWLTHGFRIQGGFVPVGTIDHVYAAAFLLHFYVAAFLI